MEKKPASKSPISKSTHSSDPIEDHKSPTSSSELKITSRTFIHENKEKFKDNYKIGHQVGSRSYGQVRKCLHIKSNCVRAVKLIPKANISSHEHIFEELEILRKLVYYYSGSS